MARDDDVRLMKIKCSMGTVENYINVDIDHGIFVGQNQQPLMNANDHTDKNIMPFGNCLSPQNPDRCLRQALLKGAIGGLTFGVGGIVSDAVSTALESAGIMTYKCKPNTPNPWEFVNEKSIVDGAPALMIESKLACRYGGIISIVYEPISNL